MNFQLTKDFIKKISLLIETKNNSELSEIFSELLAPDIAEILELLDFEKSKYLFDTFSEELGADILIELEEDLREQLLENLSSKEIVEEVIENLDSDDAADVIQELPKYKQKEVLSKIANPKQASDLADLLSWSEKNINPMFMIDLATLTGAMIISLGNVRAGLFTNNSKLANIIEESGERTGDKVWKMPLDEEYDKMINTEIADMKNIGSPGAGSITAACFLKRHVERKHLGLI